MNDEQYEAVPDGASQRRLIFIVSPADHFKLLNGAVDPTENITTHEGVHVLPTNFEPSDSKSLAIWQHLQDARLNKIGNVLVQSPFKEDEYVQLEEADTTLATMKYYLFSEFCRRLGAKSVAVTDVKISSRTSTISLDAKFDQSISPNVPGVTAEIDNEILRKAKQLICLHDEYDGAETDVVAAKNLLKDNGLSHDPAFNSLLYARSDNNQMKSRTLVLSLSRESKDMLKLAAGVKVPKFLNLSADWNKVSSGEVDYEVKMEIKF